jgi:hypothetical protein
MKPNPESDSRNCWQPYFRLALLGTVSSWLLIKALIVAAFHLELIRLDSNVSWTSHVSSVTLLPVPQLDAAPFAFFSLLVIFLWHWKRKASLGSHLQASLLGLVAGILSVLAALYYPTLTIRGVLPGIGIPSAGWAAGVLILFLMVALFLVIALLVRAMLARRQGRRA